MDPYTWDAPWFVIVGGLFVIVMLRANGTYWIGRLMEHGAHRTRLARLLDSPGYARALELVHRWGAPVVSASFLTIGVQTLVNLAAGATRMPLTRYLPAVALGGVAWALIYGTVGVKVWIYHGEVSTDTDERRKQQQERLARPGAGGGQRRGGRDGGRGGDNRSRAPRGVEAAAAAPVEDTAKAADQTPDSAKAVTEAVTGE